MTSELDRLEEAFHRLQLLPEVEQAPALLAVVGDEGATFADALRELLVAARLEATPLDASARAAALSRLTTEVDAGRSLALVGPPHSEPHRRMRAGRESGMEPSEIPGFEILRTIGRGGSSTVYLAEQRGSGFVRAVALKVVDRAADSDSRLQVGEEQRILARLEHPGIARLYDAGTAPSGQPYLAMEWIDGASILEHCRTRELPVRERVALFLAVLDAVEYAHAAGVVHRDLKPGNILVSSAGAAKLLDFGIAKWAPGPGDEKETRTLQRAMTLAYASPEQVRGGRVTAASDIYSLGVVLYELLAEVLPYRLEGTPYETYEDAIRSEEPEPPSTAYTRTKPSTTGTTTARTFFDRSPHRRALSGDLDAVVLKALRKAPEARYGSAADFASDLRRVLAGQAVAARGANRRYRAARLVRRGWKGVVAALLVALVGVGTVLVAVPAWRARWLLPLLTPRPADEFAIFASVAVADAEGRTALRDGGAALRSGNTLRAREEFTRATALLAGTAAEALAWDGCARAESVLGEVGKAASAASRAAELAAGPQAAGALPLEERERLTALGRVAAYDWATAVPALDRLFGRLPDRLDLGLDLFRALLASGQTAAANATLSRVGQLPGQSLPGSRDPRLDLAEAELAYRIGEFQRSAAAASRAIVWAAANANDAMRWRAQRLHAEAIVRLDLTDEARAELDAIAGPVAAAGLAREAARIELARGKIAARTADNAGAERILLRALAGVRSAEDSAGEIAALVALAFQATKRGDARDGLARSREAVALAQGIGDRWSEGEALVSQLVLFNWAEDAQGVLATRDRALAALRESENRQTLLSTLNNLALDATERRELDRAAGYLEEAASLSAQVGNRFADAGLDRAYGFLEESRGEFDRARERYGSALEKARRAGTPISVAAYLTDLAWLEVAADRTDAAATRAAEAIAAHLSVGKDRDAAELQGVLAWVDARRGDRTAAYGRLMQLRRSTGGSGSRPSFSSQVVEARIAEALKDWPRALELRRDLVRLATERAASGPLIDQQYALARDLHAAGERARFEKLARELLPEAEKRGVRGVADGLRRLLGVPSAAGAAPAARAR
ncbi:MAG: serine/threonine-protein kinase [Thermoanaerobaculia bacterium]